MKTGKVEYSPDYKSRQPRVKISSTGARSIEPFDIVRSEAGRAEIEAQQSCSWKADHQRLQSAVVGKARVFGIAWKTRIKDRISSRSPSEELDHAATEARIQLCEAVDALIKFEVEHGIGEK